MTAKPASALAFLEPHPNSVILSEATRALCELRSRRTCHTLRRCTPLEPFNHRLFKALQHHYISAHCRNRL